MPPEQMSARERAQFFIDLANELKSIINESSYDPGDVRRLAFSNCRSLIGTSVVVLNILSAREEDRLPDALYPELFGLSKSDATTFFNSFGKNSRLGLVALLQFQVENFLRSVLNELQPGSPPHEFMRIARRLLESVMSPDFDSRLAVLNCLQQIRNSYHSNGTHTEKSVSLTIAGKEFQFVQGQTVKCAGWEHIAIAFREVIKIMEAIVSSPSVSAITHQIPVRYSPE